MLELFSLYNNIDTFILIALRISGFILVSPIFGRREISNLLKISIVIYLCYIVIFSNNFSFEYYPSSYLGFIILSIIEIIKGFLLGLISSIFFSAFLIAGQLIDIQIGFRMGGILDPKFGIKTPLSGNILNIGALCVFLILDGHLQVINIIAHTYQLSPIGNTGFLINIYSIFTSSFALMFLAAFKIALPITLMIFIADVILVVMIKYMPQLNIFVIGIPLKIIIGLFSFFYIIEPFVNFVNPYFNNIFENMWKVMM